MQALRRAVLVVALVFPLITTLGAGEFSDRFELLDLKLGAAMEEVFRGSIDLEQGDRAASSLSFERAMARAQQLADAAREQATFDALGKKAKKINKGASKFLKLTTKAKQTIDDLRKPDKKAVKAAKKARAAGGKVRKGMRKVKEGTEPVVILEELKSRTAGFHRPDAKVCFRVHVLFEPPGGCGDVGEPDISGIGIDTFGDDVVGGHVKSSPDGREFCLTMGKDEGGAKIEVTVCGKKSSLLIYNYGDGTGGGGGGGGGGDGFAGAWSGPYTMSFDSGCGQVNNTGTLALTMTKTGDQISGTMSLNGIQVFTLPGCDPAGTTAWAGVVRGTVANGVLSGEIESDEALAPFTAEIKNGKLNGSWTFVGGTFKLGK